MFQRACLAAFLLVACGAPQTELRVSPQEGTQAGGEELRIEGDDFLGHGALVVYLGSRAAKGVVIEGDGLVRVTTPQSETTGPVDVLLRFSDGTERRIESGFAFAEQPGFVIQPRIGGGSPAPPVQP